MPPQLNYYKSYKKMCDKCQQVEKDRKSLNCIFIITVNRPSIFAHNGKLISYVNTNNNNLCNLCNTEFRDCIYMKCGEYFTLSDHSELTVIDCEIKRPLRQNSVIIMESHIGIFVLPIIPRDSRNLLFIRGITDIRANYEPYSWVNTIHYSRDGICKSSKRNLEQSIFTSFNDDEENVYLIDNIGNKIACEILPFTGKQYATAPGKVCNRSSFWKIYANSYIIVKTHGYYDKIEILANNEPVGKRTKPASHNIIE